MAESVDTRLIQDVYSLFEAQFALAIGHLEGSGQCKLADKMRSRSYSVFYNDPRYTLRQGRAYLMGLNPGGPDSHDYGSEEKESLQSWTKSESTPGRPYSAYTDEEWTNGRGKGHSNHQINVRHLLAHIQAEPYEEDPVRYSFSANLYFFRTPSEKELWEYPPALVDCWWYHRLFLSLVRPEVILCNGNSDSGSAFSEVHRRLSPKKEYEYEPVNAKRSVKWFRAKLRSGHGAPWTTVVGVPHLSQPYAAMSDILSAIDRIL